jgi:hypothetical protein
MVSKGLAKGTVGVEPAGGAEKAATARPNALEPEALKLAHRQVTLGIVSPRMCVCERGSKAAFQK